MHGIRYEAAIVIGSHVWRGLSVCWSRACTSSAKADELIEMPFAVEERPGNHVIEMGAWIPSWKRRIGDGAFGYAQNLPAVDILNLIRKV